LVEGAGSENNPGTSTFVAEHVADDDLVAQVTAGHTFSLFLTDSGQAFAAGSSESGQLGNGTTDSSKAARQDSTSKSRLVGANGFAWKATLKHHRLGSRISKQEDHSDRIGQSTFAGFG